MKVGDYVRTKRGTFDRFITSHTQDNLTWYTFEDRGNITNPENYVIKSSPNIIDLIEVGDYVNGFRVDKIEKDIDYITFGDEKLTLASKFNYDKYTITGEQIKSIVTKEMYSSVEYRVENN